MGVKTLKLLLLAGCIVAFSFGSPLFAVAASNYGDCTYGTATYGGDCTSASAPSGGGGGGVISGPASVGYQAGSTSIASSPTNTGSPIANRVEPGSTSSTTILLFTRDLELDSSGSDVRDLQTFLNTHGYLVSLNGPGSSGQETSYFGPATQAALAKFQQATGIVPPAGYFGAKTRARIAGVDVQPEQSIASSTVFVRDLELGDTGSDVRALQQYLNTHGYLLANYGPGSPGNETNVFGFATQYQLEQLQIANGITPAAGYFGPKTRAFINQ